MKILEYMTITEAAEMIRVKALEIKDKMAITEQEAYNVIFTDVEKHLGGTNDKSKYRGTKLWRNKGYTRGYVFKTWPIKWSCKVKPMGRPYSSYNTEGKAICI